MRLSEALRSARRSLAELPGGDLEAEVLLAHVLEASRSFLYANPELELPAERSSAFKSLVRRRQRGEPVAYLTGVREFWSLPLRVNSDVLIPRVDTELLVELALQQIPPRNPCRIADLGTGSGAVALALASERPRSEVWATDRSDAALQLAQRNAEELGIGNVRFARGDWFDAFSGQARRPVFDLIASNPPYVAGNDPHLDQGDCRFEPTSALTPGDDGMAALRHIAEHAPQYLVEGGWLMLEHGPQQGARVQHVLQQAGFSSVATRQDMESRDRVTLGRWQA